ncbi:ankyrin repeat-containing domain protein [Amanita rubescens]|nr:ankyrin repeat-containing domain protein [Amanita rubescens]
MYDIRGDYNEIHANFINIQHTNALSIEKYTKWLAPCDPSTNHHTAAEKHHSGTGTWLLEHKMYMDWKKDPNAFMWIHGISGAGKTVAFSTVIKDIQCIVQKGSTAMGYFYCDISDAKKRSVTDILRGLVTSLLAQEPSDLSILEKAYWDHMDGISKPSDDKLLEVLRGFIAGFKLVYLLVDALDECLDIEKILEFIQSLHKCGFVQCHLLVTSRKEQQIFESMALIKPVEIDMSKMPVDDDIAKYIDHTIQSSFQLRRWKPNDKASIRKALLENAKGMFRWVACQLDELKKCTKRNTTLNYILDHLPNTLETTYDQILSRISTADASDAMKLLLWLTFAEHPLHIDYLALIVEFDMEDKTFNSSTRGLSSPDDILIICSSLVTKMDDNTVQLAHASVKQYILERPRIIQSRIVINPSIGNEFVGHCCLAYLLHSRESHPPGDYFDTVGGDSKYMHSLIRYAAKKWPKHILAVHEDESIMEQMKKLFVLRSFAFDNWAEVNNYEEQLSSEYMWSCSLLQSAAFHGLTSIVEWLLLTADNELQFITEALCAASKYGHTATARVLLGQCMEGGYGDALNIAASCGHKEIVKLLLDQVEDMNSRRCYECAINHAAFHGHKQVVELLLERGAGMNAQGGLYEKALQAASYKGHKQIVELLLDKGANVNVQGEGLGNALQIASCEGREQVVELLLRRGADVNAQGGQYGNALQAASFKGHVTTVELLLKSGADVNHNHHMEINWWEKRGYQSAELHNTLQAASVVGCKEVVELLLDHGPKNEHLDLALHAALKYGHQEVAEVLLIHGAKATQK